MTFRVQIKNGRIAFNTEHNAARFADWAKGSEGKWMTLTPEVTRRTRSQNSYLHVLFKYLADYTGHTLEEIKVSEKRKHLTPYQKEILGKVETFLPSTADLTKQEMGDFIDRVLADCAFLGIVIPTPEELGYIPNKSYPKA